MASGHLVGMHTLAIMTVYLSGRACMHPFASQILCMESCSASEWVMLAKESQLQHLVTSVTCFIRESGMRVLHAGSSCWGDSRHMHSMCRHAAA